MLQIVTQEDLDKVLATIDELTKKIGQLEYQIELLKDQREISSDQIIEDNSNRSIIWDVSIPADKYVFTRIQNEVSGLDEESFNTWRSKGTSWIIKNIFFKYASYEDEKMFKELMKNYNLKGHKYRLNILMRRSEEFRKIFISYLDTFIEHQNEKIRIDTISENIITPYTDDLDINDHENNSDDLNNFQNRYKVCIDKMKKFIHSNSSDPFVDPFKEISNLFSIVYGKLKNTYGWVHEQSKKEFVRQFDRRPNSALEMISVDETFRPIFLNLFEEEVDKYIHIHQDKSRQDCNEYNDDCPM